MSKRIGLGLVAAALLMTGAQQADAAQTIRAHLTASPESYTGKCPATISFKGKITATAKGKVQYKFIRSDGAHAPIHTLDFAAPGTKDVSTTWQLGGPGLPTYSGWEAIQVVYPQDVVSDKANFKVVCATPKPDLVVRSFGLKEWGKCEPKHALMTFQVTVANVGNAPSPAIMDKALVQVMDQHGNGWGNGVGLKAIPPGKSETVLIPVYYLMDNPGHMTKEVPHTFKAIIDPLKLVQEKSEANNEIAMIKVDPSKVCKAEQPHPVAKEDCVSFNPATTTVQHINGNWKVVDGSHWMFDFGNNKVEAEKALGVIKRYKANQSCFVGRPGPSLSYLLVSGNSPVGSAPGEDCVTFNNANTKVEKISNSWKIVDGSHWMFDFGAKEDEARQSLAIIKKHGFNHSCFVGRPDPSLKYMRK